MTDNFPGRRRYRLILPKRQVVKIERGAAGCRFYVQGWRGIGQPPAGPVEIIDCPVSTSQLDLRLGDVLTFYTEVLAREHAEAIQ